MKEIKAPATLDSLRHFMQFVSEFAAAQQFPQARIREIELATEEAIMNILTHAYPTDCRGDIEVQCESLGDAGLTIRIVDTGIPFNPLSFTDPDLTAPITERNPGGLGVFLIRKMMDEIRYHRSENRNVLTFVARKRELRPPHV